MKIKKATKRYEAWLAERLAIVKEHLNLKHQHMAEGVFPFLRATFYRWMELWPEICPSLTKAPQVLAVGDLHCENFGTWRDIEGRLVWGVNDFDEAYPLPYTLDLGRLATSVHLAVAENHLAVRAKEASEAILAGYTEGLEKGGKPVVLAEHHEWLRTMATSKLRDPVLFWAKMEALPRWKKAIPDSARKALERMFPQRGLPYQLATRVAGLGSLGRQRFVALADWKGARVAREAKALAPSACVWASGGKGPQRIFYQRILNSAVRCSDPFVRLKGRWIVRRLAPDCCRVELAELSKERDELRMLHAMGWETANVHLGSGSAIPAVRRDLKRRPFHWLNEAANHMAEATVEDWEVWKKAQAG